MLLIRLDTTRDVMTDVMLEKIRYGLEKTGKEPKSAEVLKGYQKGLWDLFEKTFAVSWVVAAEDADGAVRVEKDIAAVLDALLSLLRKNLAHADNAASWFVHHGLISGGAAARAGWRVMFAEALLRWDERQRGKTT